MFLEYTPVSSGSILLIDIFKGWRKSQNIITDTNIVHLTNIMFAMIFHLPHSPVVALSPKPVLQFVQVPNPSQLAQFDVGHPEKKFSVVWWVINAS